MKKQNTFRQRIIEKTNKKVTITIMVLVGILLIFSTYAWFSTNLNVRVKTFTMTVKKNTGLSISLDGINFDTDLIISADELIRGLRYTYPNNTSQWAGGGLVPISSNGITNHDSPIFNMFSSSGVRYPNKDKDKGYIRTNLMHEGGRNEYNNYIAFDLFFKNDSGSPVSDNLYFEYGTSITMEKDADEEMIGLLNSARIGIVKLGSVAKDASANEVQNIECNNNCYSIIFEPNSKAHSELSIERATKYGVNLIDGQEFPTYAFTRAGGPIFVANTVSGSPNLDPNYFELQETMTDDDFEKPLFTVPNGITKTRVYVWIEGQDIDSLETDSDGAEIYISLNFLKDTQGYE